MSSKHKQPDNQWKWDTLKVYLAMGILLFVAILCASSCSRKLYEHTNTVYRDSLVVVEHTKDSLIYVPIPLESGKAIVAVGDTSHLETTLAKSDAWVGGDGALHHVLENKSDEKLPVLVPVYSKTINVAVTRENAQILTKTVYVEKPLSKWESFKLGAFWWLLGGVIGLLLYTFRNPLINVLKRRL